MVAIFHSKDNHVGNVWNIEEKPNGSTYVPELLMWPRLACTILREVFTAPWSDTHIEVSKPGDITIYRGYLR